MKYLKTFEEKYISKHNFRKFLLIDSSDKLDGSNLVLIQVMSFTFRVEGIDYIKLYNLSRLKNGVLFKKGELKKFKFDNFKGDSIYSHRISTLEKKLIKQSDNLQEMIEYMEFLRDITNFNL